MAELIKKYILINIINLNENEIKNCGNDQKITLLSLQLIKFDNT